MSASLILGFPKLKKYIRTDGKRNDVIYYGLAENGKVIFGGHR